MADAFTVGTQFSKKQTFISMKRAAMYIYFVEEVPECYGDDLRESSCCMMIKPRLIGSPCKAD
jgi:hypothetical protein